MSAEMEQLMEMIRAGESGAARDLVEELLEGGAGPETVLKDALVPAMEEVGDLFQNGEYYLPEMLMAARAMQGSLDLLKPALEERGVDSPGTAVLGTVKGDIHDIGKNLVVMTLEGSGFDVIDLGCDVAPEMFVEAVSKHSPDVLGLSALLTTTMLTMRDTIEAVKEAGLRDRVKIMIGGAPVQQEFADRIGADFYGPDSTSARDYAKSVVKEGE